MSSDFGLRENTLSRKQKSLHNVIIVFVFKIYTFEKLYMYRSVYINKITRRMYTKMLNVVFPRQRYGYGKTL